jgi:protein involved in polysaccharide export with SLBB domain
MRSKAASLALAIMVAMVVPLMAQQTPGGLTQAQIEALRRNPELIRRQIEQSGLTVDQIRAFLRAAGYPENALDTYLAAGQTGLAARAPTSDELAALEALGLPFQLAEALLPADTGAVARAGAPSRVFGVDVFRRSTTQFLPLLAGPVPPDYRLGPGDMLVLILTGDVELTHSLTVTRDGFVLIPQVGQVPVANLTLEQLRDVLYTRLGRVYSGVRRSGGTTRFDVSVANVRANQVYVVGEVAQPGAYQISALGTALTALYAAGGVTEDGSVRRVEVRRGGQVLDSLDLYDYLLRGDVRGDVRLETGDVVFVPVHATRVEVSGAVVRPAIYEVVAGETVADVIAAAGGLNPQADRRTLTVHRYLPAAERGPGPAPRAAISIALVARPMGEPGSDSDVVIPDFPLRDGDSVVVHAVPPLSQTFSVGIAGMVERPGRFPWRPGMTLRDLVVLAGGPTVGADLRAVEVARMPASRAGGVLADTLRVPMDSSYLAGWQSNGSYAAPPGPPFPAAGAATEFPLEPYDEVLVLKQPEFEFQRSVTILGEVRFPGTYALTRKDTHLSDLVARAGGLLRGAYPEGARFYRLFENTRLGGEAARRRRIVPDSLLPIELLKDRDQVNVSLPAALARPRSPADMVLQPGDSLFVPEYLPTVRVSGAVIAPASVEHVAGKNAMYYVQNAGGFAENADEGRTVVRQANGSARTRGHFLFWSSWPEPGPGAEVFVPAKTPKVGGPSWLAILATAASMLASTASVVIALSTIN